MKREDKKRDIGSVVGTVIVAILFLGSTIGFVFLYSNDKTSNENSQNYEYNGYEFVKTAQGWQTSTSFGQITTTYPPKEVLEVECNCASLNYQNLQAQKVYVIVYSQEERDAANELLMNFAFGKIQPACLPEDADAIGCENLPLRNCQDASEQSKILILKESKEIKSEEDEEQGISKLSVGGGKASFNNNCLVIEGENLIKVIDKVIYKVFGVE